jgi:hypothetical protein
MCPTWGLYGPFSQTDLILLAAPSTQPPFTLSTLIGALLVGLVGARAITSELDKRGLSLAAAKAVAARSNSNAAARIATATPREALETAANM